MDHEASRRQMLRGATATLGAIVLTGCGGSGSGGDASSGTPTPTPSPTPTPAPSPSPSPSPSPTGTARERDLLNFALNLLYLEAQFHSHAVTGTGLSASLLTGRGAAGAVTGARQSTFQATGVAERFREIHYDTLGQISLFRELLGSEAIAQPALNLGAAGPFGTIGRLVSDSALDPYADDLSLLLGAFYLIEPSISVLKRLAWEITTKTFADAVAAILAAKAGHAGIIRLQLIQANFRILQNLQISDWTMRMSNLREELGGTTDIDDETSKSRVGYVFSPASAAGYYPERLPAQTRPIYLLASPTVDRGGFFPNGLNGNPV